MDSLIVALKTAAVLAVMVLVFVGGPIWGATGSLAHAWHAVRQYSKVMGALCAVGIVLGLIAAFTL